MRAVDDYVRDRLGPDAKFTDADVILLRELVLYYRDTAESSDSFQRKTYRCLTELQAGMLKLLGY